MPLLILFILIPIIEIGLFIQVGGLIGLWPTLATVVLTAIIGTSMLRKQGISTLTRLQANLNTGQNPVDPIAHGALILVSGVLLLTPGFFTDAVGFSLLIPPIRSALIKWGATKVLNGGFVASYSAQNEQQKTDSSVLDGEFSVIDEDQGSSNGSGWTKH
jgi:UPF0716 protein FxsA